MPRLLDLLRGRTEQRMTVDEWASAFAYNGSTYGVMGLGSSAYSDAETDSGFVSRVQMTYKSDGVVFACELARLLVFSEARFQWQQMNSGRPGELFGTKELALLERPWPNGTTGELLARMEQDASFAGNAYVVNEGDRLRRLRPDWVEIVLSAPPADAVKSDVVGYRYSPAGTGKPVLYLPERVAHYSPIPDPEAQYRGMSWVTPVMREIAADKAATRHKLKFFENGATPQLAVSFKESVTEAQFKAFIATMNAAHQGVDNAYRTLYLGGGADVTVVGKDLHQLDFKMTQGGDETRIAAAAGVPPIIVGLSEGLQSATYSNYTQARRRFADGTLRPLWRTAASALETLFTVPAGSRLWYDDRDIAFLREDAKDSAEIEGRRASTINALVTAGFKPDDVVDAVMAEDLTRLKGKHTGLFSVQLQPPTTSSNGSPSSGVKRLVRDVEGRIVGIETVPEESR